MATVVVTGLLAAFGRLRRAALHALAAASVVVAVLLGKLLIVPTNANHQFGLTLSGFPSGHTADSTVLAGSLLLLLVPAAAVSARVAAAAGAALVGAAVGWSRVHTAAHSVPEVVAGWLLGTAVVCALAAALGSACRADR